MKKVYAVTVHTYDHDRNCHEHYLEIFANHAYNARCLVEQDYRKQGYIPGHNMTVYEVKELY